MGLKESTWVKDWLLLLTGMDVILPLKDAIIEARKARFVVEDGSVALYRNANGNKSYNDMRKSADIYYRGLVEKHRNSEIIIVTSDDFSKVSLAKKPTQKSRDASSSPFTDEELEMLGDDAFLSFAMSKYSSSGFEKVEKLFSELQEKYLSEQRENNARKSSTNPTAKLKKRTSGKVKLPNELKDFFPWYVKKALATRALKRDVAFHLYVLMMDAHNDHTMNVIGTEETPFLYDDQRMILDGLPFTPRLNAAAISPTRLSDNLLSGEYEEHQVEGAYKSSENPVKISDTFMRKYYVAKENTGHHTAMVSLSRQGIHLLPHTWRTVLGEADHKLVSWMRRMVAEIRDNPGTSDEVPTIFITTVDTDAIPMLLEALDIIYDGDEKNIDFRLLVDLTPPANPYVCSPIYDDICNFIFPSSLRISGNSDRSPMDIEEYLSMRDSEYSELFKGYTLGKENLLWQVFDLTLVWKRLRNVFERDIMPGARHPFQVFSQMMIIAGTDFVQPVLDCKTRDIMNVVGMGGYMFLDKGIKLVDRPTQYQNGIVLNTPLLYIDEEQIRNFLCLLYSLKLKDTVAVRDVSCLFDGRRTIFEDRKFRSAFNTFDNYNRDNVAKITELRRFRRELIYKPINTIKKLCSNDTQQSTFNKYEQRIFVLMNGLRKVEKREESLAELRNTYLDAVRHLRNLCIGEFPMVNENNLFEFVFDIDELKKRESVHRRKKPGRKKRKVSSNGLYSSSGSPRSLLLSAIDEWGYNRISDDLIDVVVRLVHHNHYLWVHGSYTYWKDVVPFTDAGYNILENEIRYAKSVLQL